MASGPIVLVPDEIVNMLRGLMESGVPGRPVPIRQVCPSCHSALVASSQFVGTEPPGETVRYRRFKVIVRCNTCERRFETGRAYDSSA